MTKTNAAWLNKDSRTFLSRGYLTEGETAEDRIRGIAEAAEGILKIAGFADKLEEDILRGWISLSSPIWSNFGRERGLPISCNGSYYDDSTSEILRKNAEIGMMTKHGAGTSAYMGALRPRGSDISDGGKTEGPVHFIEGIQTTVNMISQSSVRRGNAAVYLPIEHPDAKEFLTIKDEGSPYQHVSFGVTVTDDWMDSMIAGDKDKQKLWTRIIQKRFETGYPYIIFIDTVNRGRSRWYKEQDFRIYASNLCFSGDTLVAVADGRNAVRIDELDGTEFPVYSARRFLGSKKGWKTEVKNARAFKTGVKKVVSVVLDDGTEFRCTPDHRLALAQGGYIKASDAVGSQLQRFFSTKKSNYRVINSSTNGFAYQHRMVWEHENGLKPDGFHIDHLLPGHGDGLDNLQLLESSEHFSKTSSEVMGDNNAVHKIADRDAWITGQSRASFRENNARWSGVTDQEIISAAMELVDSGAPITVANLRKINQSIPKAFSKNRFNGSIKNLRKIIRGEIEYVEPEIREDVAREELPAAPSNPVVIEVVDRGEVEDVYDLNVDDNHNFFIITAGDDGYVESRGVLVHNCTEIALPSAPDLSFVCDLLSLNVLHYDEWRDTDLYFRATALLDAVMTEYIEKARGIPFMRDAVRFAEEHRAIGVGVLGWHSYLQSKMIPFESLAAKQLNVDIFKTIRMGVENASADLASLYGEPKVMKGYGFRNSAFMAPAPTTSSSFILGQVSPSIEPENSNYYVKDLAKGKFTYKNPHLKRLLREKGMDSPEVWSDILVHGGSVQHMATLTEDERAVFKTFGEIPQIEVITQAAQRQRYIDQSQSLNVMIHPDASVKDVNMLLIEAWKLGVKSLYYQRSTNPAQEFARSLLSCVACEA